LAAREKVRDDTIVNAQRRDKVRDDTIVNAQRRDIIGYVTKE
jgi:hypothetical protein